MSQFTNPQRSSNFWEIIYSPNENNSYEKWEITDCDINTTIGKKNTWVDIGEFEKITTKHIKRFNFDHVDFKGEFKSSYMTFNECEFKSCSFYRSSWKNVKFRNCFFQETSFSISRFENCEFRDCKFKDISISGNEMKFINTYIEPHRFITAAKTNLDRKVLKQEDVKAEYQIFKLEKTKSTAARMLLKMKPIKNDIDTFMHAKRITRKSESFFLIKKNYHDVLFGSIMAKVFGLIRMALYFIEYLFIFAIGWLNGWGLKAGKSIVLGFLCTIVFSLYYYLHLFKHESFAICYLRELEYWFLFGYTMHDVSEISLIGKTVIFLNSLLGLFWFATILPVLIEKMGKENE